MDVNVEVDVMASLRERGEFLDDDGKLPAPGESSPESILDSLLLLFRIGSSTSLPYVQGVWVLVGTPGSKRRT